jgi:AraC-like DNA-binding protein
VVAIADGTGRFTIDGRTWPSAGGDLFWIPPGVVHEMEGFAPGQSLAYVHLDLVYRPDRSHWDFSIKGGTIDLTDYAPFMHPPLAHPLLDRLPGLHQGPAARRGAQLVREIVREAARAQPLSMLRMSALATELVAELLRGRQGSGGEADLPLLEQAATQLARLGDRARIADLAAGAGLSPSHFRTRFAQVYGVSPRTYGRRARLNRAKDLMVASSLSLSEIARRCGFADVHAFSKAFRQVEGTSPSDYRRCGAQARVRVEGRRVPYPY